MLTVIHQVLVIHCHTFMNKCATAKKQWGSLRQNPCDQQRRRQKADPVKVSVLINTEMVLQTVSLTLIFVERNMLGDSRLAYNTL